MNDEPISRRDFCSVRFLARLAQRTLRSVQETRTALVQQALPVQPAPAAAPPPRSMPLLRPPKAVAEAPFIAGCTRCDACISACPHQALVRAPMRLRGAAGTPIIDAAESPCLMCTDMPCVTACVPQVLHPDLPARMGTARVLDHLCQAGRGIGCSACVERCPVPGAIRLVAGRPVIDPETCTGCGVCLHVCPAPSKAILLLPERERPSAPSAVAPSAAPAVGDNA